MQQRSHHQSVTTMQELDRSAGGQPLRWLSLLGPVVYSIRTSDGLIKIGFTTDLGRRAAVLGGASNLIAWRPGTWADEQAIHRFLGGLAVRGREWYPPADLVLSVVNAMRLELGLPAAA